MLAIMVRYQGKVATFRATAPLGATVEKSAARRINYIDDLVFTKLKAMGMPTFRSVRTMRHSSAAVSLDIAGPSPQALEETQRFLADTDLCETGQTRGIRYSPARSTPITSPTNGSALLRKQTQQACRCADELCVLRLDSRTAYRQTSLTTSSCAIFSPRRANVTERSTGSHGIGR